ncbi:hypothetical protein Pla123a_33100 [Posidoniimonas polymericola]|uniref:Uncharacterized protein n=1 Tax=Posidoniimonas polymericola TaxID=2528002 RepID=A0A5C5YFI5_9BACT|nr:hypothetical protein [Posidoniimonas polymericola]TWT74487.1 hypothetical protein Pla123a_33100 [Posidoniimonas polymericola]
MADSANPSRHPIAAYVLVVVGVAAVVIGLLWKVIVPDTAFWSDAQAEQYEQAYAAAHEASIHGSAGSHDHGDHTEAISLEDAKARFETMHQQLANARAARGLWGKVLSVAGVVCAAAGAWILRAADPAR